MNVPPDLMLLGKAALTGVLGFMVGWERELHGHAAGVRTIALMTMGSTVLTSIALSSFPVTDRIVANILTGVEFLGAGLILHAQNDKVHGLTSAAAIWAMTSVSIIIGLGHYLLGIGLTGFVLLDSSPKLAGSPDLLMIRGVAPLATLWTSSLGEEEPAGVRWESPSCHTHFA